VDQPEAQNANETRHGGGVLRRVWIVGIALVLYVLSVGPVFRAADHHLVSWSRVRNIYRPLFMASGRWQWFSSAGNWYVGIWTRDYDYAGPRLVF